MGSYSYFGDENIEVKDLEGLKKFLKIWKKEYGGDGENYNIVKKRDGKEIVTFEDWNEIKLISYYYDRQLLFFKLVAQYIEGNVSWEFESKEEAGDIEFKDGECLINTGQMNWTTWKPDESMGVGEHRKDFKIPDTLKKLMIINSLK